MYVVVAAPDKFRGTGTAPEIAAAICAAARSAGRGCDAAPLSDGGEGLLEALGGTPRTTRVRGPLSAAVDAEWRLLGRRAGGGEGRGGWRRGGRGGGGRRAS
ncbi:MAG: glycerate kinase [Acidimicrobiales bacterium]